jgi:hypothetical protein
LIFIFLLRKNLTYKQNFTNLAANATGILVLKYIYNTLEEALGGPTATALARLSPTRSRFDSRTWSDNLNAFQTKMGFSIL